MKTEISRWMQDNEDRWDWLPEAKLGQHGKVQDMEAVLIGLLEAYLPPSGCKNLVVIGPHFNSDKHRVLIRGTDMIKSGMVTSIEVSLVEYGEMTQGRIGIESDMTLAWPEKFVMADEDLALLAQQNGFRIVKNEAFTEFPQEAIDAIKELVDDEDLPAEWRDNDDQ